ncbi:hypothetical protein [Xylophilus sp. GOD-11R]|uniref:hypothetical protein n=1 Tax=Xylophilus sp. GOD-11R TaxID=3089814 RepID=UPI00298C0010|nr:hypothetical protein [Xylophilus sp. GOD-11R]WPB58669.1 hypothetical protein R9X41_08535 [Xylophilus sp. GOD-11R]
MAPIALGLLALYVPFGLLFFGLANVARRADSLDAKARAIAQQNMRRQRAARAGGVGNPQGEGLAVV